MDIEQKKELLSHFKSLKKILDENKLEYSLFAGTLLGAKHFNGMIPWDDDIDLIVSYETYKFLVKKYPDNVLKSNDKGYPLFFSKWVQDKNNIKNSTNFIDLFVAVKTNEKKWKEFRSFKNKLRFGIYSIHNGFRPFIWQLWIFKFFTYPLKWFIRKNLDFDSVYKKLYTKDGDKLFVLVNPAEENKKCEITGISLKTEKSSFEGMKVNILIDHKEYFAMKYGDLNMEPPSKKDKIWIHTNVFNIKLGTWDGD